MATSHTPVTTHNGLETFDSFLVEQGTYEEVHQVAESRVLEWMVKNTTSVNLRKGLYNNTVLD